MLGSRTEIQFFPGPCFTFTESYFRAVSKIVCQFWEHQKMSNLEKLMYIFFFYMHGVENLRLYEVSHTGPGETKGKTRNVAKMWLYEFL